MLLLSILVIFLSCVICKSQTDGSSVIWKCDDLTPDLCPLEVEEGDVPTKAGLLVHYWRYRRQKANPPLSTSPSSLLPIITLHGGPSYTHNYMLPLKQQACRGREIIFYDQAGCGKSLLPKPNASVEHDYPFLLDPMYYAKIELPALISHLNIEKYHIIGNSWGTMLAQLYALDANPGPAMASMVLSGPLSDAKSYIQAQWDEEDGNLGSLPPYVQERLHILEEQGLYESEEYTEIADTLTSFFTCRTSPLPDCFTISEKTMNKDIYVGMQGPSEFTFGGTLSEFNVTGRLHTIEAPVLLTSGRYDTMRPKIVKVMNDVLPVSEWVILERSGHVSMLDEPGLMNDMIANFFITGRWKYVRKRTI